ncbi:MAG: CotH kinase family protein [Clostridia bacterium]|nr:CotH kinase family protein [Clostridia bacterium]
MKKSIWILLSVFLLAVCLSACISANGGETLGVWVSAENGEAVEIFPTDGNFYLPSAVDLTKIRFSFDGDISYGTGVLKTGEAMDLTPFKTEDERGAECYRLTLSFGGKTQDYTFYHDSKLGSVFVQTSLGLPAIDGNKENRDKNAGVLILDELGETQYSDAAAQTVSEIKSRGNATWTYLKKAYQIKLDSKTDLFGMGKSKTWILLANYTDQSALHNALGFMLGDKVGVPYNTQYRFVNFYADGEYRGMYMLCEKAQIGDNRVEIEDLEKATEKANPDRELDTFPIREVTSGDLIRGSVLMKYTYCEGVQSPEDVTGGYLVELDFRGEQEPCHFVTESGNIYVVKSPEYASREEMEYIAGLFADMEEAIYSDSGYNRKYVHYSEYLDMESFAGVYTVQELMKNWDAYLGSMFFFKDADQDGETAKIYNGPLWDLDNTLGNINYNYAFGQDTAYLWAQNGEFQNLPRGFGKNLMKHPEFQNAVKETYALAYAASTEALSEGGWIARSVETMGESIVMDRTRWRFYDPNGWLLSQSGHKVTNVKFVQFKEYGTPSDSTKDTALGFLRYYLSARADALLQSIGQGAQTPPPVTPPEESSSSKETVSSSSQTPVSSEQASASTVDTASDSSEPTSDVGAEPYETVISPVAVAAALGVVFVISGVVLTFVFVKKRRL